MGNKLTLLNEILLVLAAFGIITIVYFFFNPLHTNQSISSNSINEWDSECMKGDCNSSNSINEWDSECMKGDCNLFYDGQAPLVERGSYPLIGEKFENLAIERETNEKNSVVLVYVRRSEYNRWFVLGDFNKNAVEDIGITNVSISKEGFDSNYGVRVDYDGNEYNFGLKISEISKEGNQNGG